jgi:hypothetical protein
MYWILRMWIWRANGWRFEEESSEGQESEADVADGFLTEEMSGRD